MARGEQAGATSVSKVLLVLPERREAIIGPRQLDARQAPRDPLRRALWLLQVGGRPAADDPEAIRRASS